MKQQRSMKVKSFRFELFLSLSLSRSPRNYAPSFGSTFSNLFISGRKENSIARIIGLGSSIRSARRHCCAFHVKSFRGFLILAYRLSSLSLFHPNPCSRSLIYAPFLKSSGTARESDIYPSSNIPSIFPLFSSKRDFPSRSTRRSHPRVTANSFYRLSFDECLQEMSR